LQFRASSPLAIFNVVQSQEQVFFVEEFGNKVPYYKLIPPDRFITRPDWTVHLAVESIQSQGCSVSKKCMRLRLRQGFGMLEILSFLIWSLSLNIFMDIYLLCVFEYGGVMSPAVPVAEESVSRAVLSSESTSISDMTGPYSFRHMAIRITSLR
jgi:hypothetical protein